jgi:integrase
MLKLKRRGDVWHVDGVVDATFGAQRLSLRVRESTRTRDRKAAEAAARRIEAAAIAELERRYKREAGIDETTFEEAALAYMEAGHGPRFLKPLIIHFRGRRVSDITEAEIERAGRALYPKAQPSTRHRQAVTPARAVLNYYAGKRPRPRQDNPRTRWLTPEEAESLIAACKPRLRRVVVVLLGTGLRMGELLALQVRDISQGSGEALIAAERDGASKTGHPRWIVPPERAWQALLDGLPETGAAFRTPKGNPYRLYENGGGQMSFAFNAARERAGLGQDVTPHVLRHTWATWFYAATGDTLRLEARGGWRSPAMVRRYTKLAPSDLPERLLAHGWDFGGDRGRDRGDRPNALR